MFALEIFMKSYQLRFEIKALGKKVLNKQLIITAPILWERLSICIFKSFFTIFNIR